MEFQNLERIRNSLIVRFQSRPVQEDRRRLPARSVPEAVPTQAGRRRGHRHRLRMPERTHTPGACGRVLRHAGPAFARRPLSAHGSESDWGHFGIRSCYSLGQ